MIPGSVLPLANHLWQSTLVALSVLALTLLLRGTHARARYWLWFAASMKFLVPFSLLVSAGSQIEWRRAAAPAAPVFSSSVQSLHEPFSPPPRSGAVITASRPPRVQVGSAVLLGIWLVGMGGVLATWIVRWQRMRKVLRQATPLTLGGPVPVVQSPTTLEPGVFGILRPVLLLPEGIADRLTPEQLRAILAHEFCHVQRRDNLASAVHMLVQAVFWFHPMVWWIGARLIEERERACDEEVVRLGSEPQVYAEGILNVCKFYLESPLACAAGVTGADLKKRIEEIMTKPRLVKMSLARKMMLAVAGVAAVGGPVTIGVLNAPRGRAQTAESEPTFEVASLKRADPNVQGSRVGPAPGGGLRMENVTLHQMITFAYDVKPFQVSGGPDWIDSDRYTLLAKTGDPSDLPAKPGPGQKFEIKDMLAKTNRMRARLRPLLTERFQLIVRKDTKELPVYELVVGKTGHKLKAADETQPPHMRNGRGEMMAQAVPIQLLVDSLSMQAGRTVVDRTGLEGRFSFDLHWAPDPGMGPGLPGAPSGPGGPGGPAAAPADISGPSLFTAVQEQLGLKLESSRAPVPAIIVTRAEKPSEN